MAPICNKMELSCRSLLYSIQEEHVSNQMGSRRFRSKESWLAKLNFLNVRKHAGHVQLPAATRSSLSSESSTAGAWCLMTMCECHSFWHCLDVWLAVWDGASESGVNVPFFQTSPMANTSDLSRTNHQDCTRKSVSKISKSPLNQWTF